MAHSNFHKVFCILVVSGLIKGHKNMQKCIHVALHTHWRDSHYLVGVDYLKGQAKLMWQEWKAGWGETRLDKWGGYVLFIINGFRLRVNN